MAEEPQWHENDRQTLLAHRIRFGSPEEIAEELAMAGCKLGSLLDSHLPGAAPTDRLCFEVLWDRARAEKSLADWTGIGEAL